MESLLQKKHITEFEEKPEKPRSNLASMGIYIFTWKVLKEALISMKDQSNCDFGKHVIPYCHSKQQRLFAYEYNGYWKDVGTLGSYWEANMELIDLIPEFNLYEEYWRIYTKSEIFEPQYLSEDAVVEKSIIGEGSEIYGEVHSSVIGANDGSAKAVLSVIPLLWQIPRSARMSLSINPSWQRIPRLQTVWF